MKVLVFILLLPLAMTAQDLEKHRWENRLIIISSPTFQNQQAVSQLNVLKNKIASLENRKLIIYSITNKGYTINFEKKVYPLENEIKEIKEFTVLLIGLDGSEKYRSTSPQLSEQFFSLIDKMPIRKAEIKNK